MRTNAATPGQGSANLTEIVIPIYNEQEVLAASVHRLRAHLRTHFPYPFLLTIADNGSTDGSWDIASRLTDELPDVRAVRVPLKGRGGAIRYAWARSEAVVVAYMDVDLSIDLDAFAPLVASVMSGHSELAIGTRYGQASYVDRTLTRAFFSRSYNYLLRNGLGARFSDGMCGFKAARRDVVQTILPEIRDDRWFFDTELLLLAQQRGLRIHEVPVVCIDDPDSSVHVLRDSCDDLVAMWRVAPRLLDDRAATRFDVVASLGAAAWLGLFLALAGVLPAVAANAVALVATAVLSSIGLRVFSFGVRGAARAIGHQLRTWTGVVRRLVATTVGLGALELLVPGAGRPAQVAVLVGSAVLAGVVGRAGRRPGRSSSPAPVPLRPVRPVRPDRGPDVAAGALADEQSAA